MTPDAAPPLLLAAVRQAPRPYRLPALPADADAARAAGADAALALALERVRAAHEDGLALPSDTRPLFLWGLAATVHAALREPGGDPAFQAEVLKSRDADVREHTALQAQAAADARAVRTAVAAMAHPAKLERMASAAARQALAPLHGLAAGGEWEALHRALGDLLQPPPQVDATVQQALGALHGSASLQRLRRGAGLLGAGSVRRYTALCSRRAPPAGSEAARATGRAAARVGGQAEADTLCAFAAIAGLLNQRCGEPGGWRAVQGLRAPAGFPGAAFGAKEEWDVALVRTVPEGGPVDLVLLAEVKASATAAATDLPKLRRGLQRLACAGADGADAANGGNVGHGNGNGNGNGRVGVGHGDVQALACDAGELIVTGRSLRALRPPVRGLPLQVFYCCDAPADASPRWLGPAAKAALLAEPASLAFAAALADGGVPGEDSLLPAWQALMQRAPRLRVALEQYDAARLAREAMLRPQDLLATLQALARVPAAPGGGAVPGA